MLFMPPGRAEPLVLPESSSRPVTEYKVAPFWEAEVVCSPALDGSLLIGLCVTDFSAPCVRLLLSTSTMTADNKAVKLSGQVASIQRAAENDYSRKLGFRFSAFSETPGQKEGRGIATASLALILSLQGVMWQTNMQVSVPRGTKCSRVQT